MGILLARRIANSFLRRVRITANKVVGKKTRANKSMRDSNWMSDSVILGTMIRPE